MAEDDAKTNAGATATEVSSEGTRKAKKRKRNRAPDGQTAAGSGELGAGADENYDESVTRPDRLGVAQPTRIHKLGSKETAEVPKIFTQLADAMGLDESDILSYNERSRIVVLSNGGKYQISKNGKGLRHHSGPPPPADLKLDVVDARQRSPLVGTAAALNAPAVVPEADENEKRARRDAIREELAALDEELGTDDEDDDEDEE